MQEWQRSRHCCRAGRQAGISTGLAYSHHRLTYYRTLSHNLEGPVAGMMTSHQLLVGAWQQKLKPVLVSCRKFLVQLQHIYNIDEVVW